MEKSFYEILEVPADATAQQIERAYRIARATYRPASMATYSVFSEEESARILRGIEAAYAVLSDARLRREYDARPRREGQPPPPRPQPVQPPRRAEPEPSAWVARSAREMELELDEPAEPADGVYDGAVLRRIRLSRGIELEEISGTTKISEKHLECIEGNRYPDLPAPVYLRGFLREVARSLKLDPKRVVDTYMQRHDARREG